MKLTNGWNFDPKWDYSEFMHENIGKYEQAFIESNPDKAHYTRDGDYTAVEDWMESEDNKETIRNDMTDCYYEWLGDNM